MRKLVSTMRLPLGLGGRAYFMTWPGGGTAMFFVGPGLNYISTALSTEGRPGRMKVWRWSGH